MLMMMCPKYHYHMLISKVCSFTCCRHIMFLLRVPICPAPDVVVFHFGACKCALVP